MLPLIRQEPGSETMAEATGGSAAPGTRDRPASSFNAGDQQKEPVIHRALAFLINFQSALFGVLGRWFDPQIGSWMLALIATLAVRRSQCRIPEHKPFLSIALDSGGCVNCPTLRCFAIWLWSRTVKATGHSTELVLAHAKRDSIDSQCHGWYTSTWLLVSQLLQ